jgi:hypothetical protein
MFDKKIVTITSFFVSEAHATPNLHTTLRICGLKGGKSRWPKSEKKLPRKNQPREKGISA